MATSREGGGGGVVTSHCLEELLDFFSKCGYKAGNTDKRFQIIEKTCLHLLARDYDIKTVDNSNGQLCPHYPAHLFILNELKKDAVNDVNQIKELFKHCKTARSLCRFPVPVILIGGKNICRSSTLSTTMELYGRTGLEWMFSAKSRSGNEGDAVPQARERRLSEWSLVDEAREFDSQLLADGLRVRLICDLMVEMRKTQYGFTLTSSEKADGSLWYSQFNIASLPYPGCEFFIQYQTRKDCIEELHYDWSLPLNDAVISVPSPLSESVGIDFKLYKSWNIIEHTQKYLKLLLHFLQYEEGGLLVHCVAGWDRTPLFISLLRLSLWADNHIHCSLSPHEMLYLTLAYDWFLFGHKFEERLHKKEEVLYFCFDFLQYITLDDYVFRHTPPLVTEEEPHLQEPCPSINNQLKPHLLDDKETQQVPLSRFDKLTILRELFIDAYERAIPLAPPTEEVPVRENGWSGLWGRVTSYLPTRT